MKILTIVLVGILASSQSCSKPSAQITKNNEQMKTTAKEVPAQNTKVSAFTPNLMVMNVNATVEFYTKVLGFKLEMTAPNTGTYDWAMVSIDGIRLMFQSTATLQKEFELLKAHDKGGALTFFVQTADTKTWYEQVKQHATMVKSYGITTYNGAKEFVIEDPNGFILHFSDIVF